MKWFSKTTKYFCTGTGFYAIPLEYFRKEKNSSLQLIYLNPGSDNGSAIPFKFQYHT